jgi:ketosteroid isomerase-like protein
MSQQMRDVVRRACAAWSSGDLSLLYDLYTPDVTADGGRIWFETEGVTEGVDAVVQGFGALIGVFERNELIPEGAIETADTLVVPLFWRGLPTGSASYVEQRLVGTFTFRDGRIAHMSWYLSLDDALAALGLPPTAAGEIVPIEPPPERGAG